MGQAKSCCSPLLHPQLLELHTGDTHSSAGTWALWRCSPGTALVLHCIGKEPSKCSSEEGWVICNLKLISLHCLCFPGHEADHHHPSRIYNHPSLQHYDWSGQADPVWRQFYRLKFISKRLLLWGSPAISIRTVQVHGLDDLLDCLPPWPVSHITWLRTSAEAHEIIPLPGSTPPNSLCAVSCKHF